MALSKYRKLHGRCVEVLGSYGVLAKKLGISRQALSNKLVGRTNFSTDDIKKIANILNIAPEDIYSYFLAD